MSEDDAGDGDHSVMLPECVQMFREIKNDNQYIRKALWGGEGTTGMVKDLNDIKQQSRMVVFFASTIVGIMASVVTTAIILFMSKLF